MQLSDDDVRHIAKLARLGLTDAEVKQFGTQLSSILTHAKTLDEVDTEGVEPIAQITDLSNITFEDEVEACAYTKELLAQSPQDVQGNMIRVNNVF